MDLAGTWTGQALVVELAIAGGQVSGVIALGGARMPLRGVMQGDALVAAFEAQGHSFELVARREGDALVIESDGQAYRLLRASSPRPINPLSAARAAPTATATDDDETVYRHATGGEVHLPRGWQVTHSPLGLQLVPPDAAYTPHGPAEVYVMNVLAAPGIARADDPRVLATVEASLRQLLPTLAAESAPVPCGPGVRVSWRGANPMGGMEVLAVALLQLAHDSVVGIIGLGERARLEARLSQLERIFASYRRGEGRRDLALVGTWHYWSYRSSAPALSGSNTSSETRRTVQLGADGSVIERSSHDNIGNFSGKDGLGRPEWDAGYASQSADGRAGVWTAGDAMLFVTWADGAQAAWHYQLQGTPGARRLTLHAPAAGEPMEWTEQPVVV